MDPKGLLRQAVFGSILGSMKPRHDDPQFKFRIPQELKEHLEKHARLNERTLTAEIIYRLERSVRADSSVEESTDNFGKKYLSVREKIAEIDAAIERDKKQISDLKAGIFFDVNISEYKDDVVAFVESAVHDLEFEKKNLVLDLVKEIGREKMRKAFPDVDDEFATSKRS